MATEDDPLIDAVARVSEGKEVDWAALDARAASESQRAFVNELKVVAGIARLARQSEASPGADEPAVGGQPMAGTTGGPLTWEHLKLLERVGSGSFGDVYRAWDSRLDREVALKLIRAPETGEDAHASSIIEEGRLLARVRHPNVVTVHGAERIGETVGIWTEFVDGRSLAAIVQDDGPLEPGEVTRIGLALCQALSAVHAAGLLHRDIKPQNVMRGRDGRIVLMDFGTGAELARKDHLYSFAGTPLFVAPEILAGAPSSARSEVYSAAAVLFYLLTGRPPREAGTVDSLQQAHAGRGPEEVRDVRRDVPPWLAGAIQRGLSVHPADRFASVDAFASALGTGNARQLLRGRLLVAAIVLTPAILGGTWLARHRLDWRDPATRLVTRQIRNPPCMSGPGRDGQWTACVELPQSVRERGGDFDQQYVLLFNTRTGEKRTLFTSRLPRRFGGVSLSPEGNYVAYSLNGGSEPPSVHTYDLRTGAARRVGVVDRVSNLGAPGWTGAESLGLRFWRQGGGTGYVTVSLDTGEVQHTLEFDGPVQGMSPSPDGTRLAIDVIQTRGAPERDIRVCEIGTGRCDTAVAHPANDFLPAWTPDGRIFFTSDRGRTFGLWAVRIGDLAAEGAPQLLLDLGRSWISSLAFTDDGWYYFQKWTGDMDIYAADLDPERRPGGIARLLSRFAPINKSPALSRDGEWLAYVSQRTPFMEEGGARVVVRRLADGSEREFVHDMHVASSRLRWSPDSSRLAVRGLPTRVSGQGPAFVHLLDPVEGRVAGAVPRRGVDETLVREFDWASDTGLAFSGAKGIGRIDVVSGAWEILFAPDAGVRAGRLAVSPDLNWIAFTLSDRIFGTRVMEMPATGGAPRELARFPPPELAQVESWSADGAAVLVIVGRAGIPLETARNSLYSVPRDGGPMRPLGLSEFNLHDVLPHFDGRRVFFVAGSHVPELWSAIGLR